MKCNSFVLFFSFLVIPCCVFAELVKVEKFEIVDYGIYDAQPTDRKLKSEGTSYGKINPTKVIKLSKQTHRIPAKIGIQFGFRYFIEGFPKGSVANVTYRILHPALQNPKTKSTHKEEKFQWKCVVGNCGERYWGGHFFGFSEEWEIKPGKWTFQLFHKDQKVVEKEFIVYQE